VITDAPSWAPCGMCGWMALPGNDSCTCADWLNPVSRHRMEREVKRRHNASVSLAMARVVIGKAAA
jgi:hypothetical protein